MATQLSSLEKIEESIQKASPEEQRRLLIKLPHLLKLDVSDLILLKIAESSFDFWNNPDDTVYDSL
ncbi:hypothetical protein A3I27_03805 [Candidatus Giovannonibacteria bacterium RIFCSPLOWO2_02_FULL_43_11b]|uniref:Uncharacterized protein n=1 Tax=Candidatus Giovannonibacteria bacterium RIFCSPHIGHO2_12_FULL_43_15 TaxID=1798341 RepID=A0A1F5WNP3_9BACT|nr:MAG: hypothetical protein A3F23_03425 [Candidatus Giovannonibacteria bacterium RIFCSPHIGHO2_12_FULL_43_15]OGF89109.1 MAG: hypothetical protein A3I27_03805 [Candidatus Giovannonibacteria bacterium RIFCSPLOWO2_02_FULL_43_11b]OGF92540.1 MAG: hypothetical protein A3H04_02280 [Candidatus Giovannonibacteria bacterium RIFCSPLOWO2_12_FULL_43_11c]